MESVSVDILMSTMNRKDLSFIDQSIFDRLEEYENLFLVLINQCTNIDENLILAYNTPKIRIISYKGKGLSESRNIAIDNSKSEIGIIADDDVIYKKEYLETVLKQFNGNQLLDILIGKIETPIGQPEYKNYRKDSKKINLYSLGSISSIEISFRNQKIKERKIKYDLSFGLGSNQFPNGGEENIFISDCLRSNLLVKYVPEYVVQHPYESTGKVNKFDENYFRFLGAFSYRLFGEIGFGMLVYYLIRHRKKINKLSKKRQFVKAFLKGFKKFARAN